VAGLTQEASKAGNKPKPKSHKAPAFKVKLIDCDARLKGKENVAVPSGKENKTPTIPARQPKQSNMRDKKGSLMQDDNKASPKEQALSLKSSITNLSSVDFLRHPSQKHEEGREKRRRIGRTTRQIDIHGQYSFQAMMTSIAAAIDTT
jgi:hypothetical protein